MRAQIGIPGNLQRVLRYHEAKVEKGVATLIHAHNFYKTTAVLQVEDKKSRFQQLMDLNERAKTKLIHISLSFHPSEKHRLDKAFYTQLADSYMNRMGFGDQPYLVYRHNDAGHPHIHILSTLIRSDGSRINTHLLLYRLSEPARKEMEKVYGLMSRDRNDLYWEKQLGDAQRAPQKIRAGQVPTGASIEKVLAQVLDQYRYTSLSELNTLLRLYNVRADRGKEDSWLYKNRGLTYVVTDDNGKPLTMPVKASSFSAKPTLAAIEKKCVANSVLREPHRLSLIAVLERRLRTGPSSLTALARRLKKDKVDLVAKRTDQGRLIGLTYIDHQSKTVFESASLGKAYEPASLIQRLDREKHRSSERFQARENTATEHASGIPTEAPAIKRRIIEQVVDPYAEHAVFTQKGRVQERTEKKSRDL